MSETMAGVRSISGGSVAAAGAAKKKTTSSCPFGEGFYAKITKLLLSKEPTAIKELKDCVKMVRVLGDPVKTEKDPTEPPILQVSAAKLTPSDEFWDSGDELAGVDAASSSSSGAGAGATTTTSATTTSSSPDIRPIHPKKPGTDRYRTIHLDIVPGAEKRTSAKAKVSGLLIVVELRIGITLDHLSEPEIVIKEGNHLKKNLEKSRLSLS